MFELVDSRGNSARMKNGDPFRYSTAALAKIAKHYLDIRDETFYAVKPVF